MLLTLCIHFTVIECPNTFVAFNVSFYCYSSPQDLATWSKARTKCQQNGDSYNLVIIDDESEYNFVKDITQDLSSEFWIGLRKQRKFHWVDGSTLSYGATLKSYPWKKYPNGQWEPDGVSLSETL